MLFLSMEKYSRGRRGAPAKGVGRETGARVQIPPSPPTKSKHEKVLVFLRAENKKNPSAGGKRAPSQTASGGRKREDEVVLRSVMAEPIGESKSRGPQTGSNPSFSATN